MENSAVKKEGKIFTISEYIGFVNDGLKNFNAKIIGEISEAKMNSKGHMYFTLKDEKDGSIIGCAIWKFRYDIFGIELKEGMKIIAAGCPNLHSQYGFSFIAYSIEIAGEGALKKEYERLKKKLTEEGAFAESRKRPIPMYPQKIGIITSLRSGVVIADFSNNLGKFGFDVKMVDSRVEGQEAVMDLLSSIKFFKKQNIEVLVIMRGGGSFEAMMAFNNEKLVREVVNFPVPVIAAIGHHKDMPLVALASDIAVSTPSIAAILLSESWKGARYLLEKSEMKIINGFKDYVNEVNVLVEKYIEVAYNIGNSIIDRYKSIRNKLDVSFQNLKNNITNKKTEIDNSFSRSIVGFKSLLFSVKQKSETKISFSDFQRILANTNAKVGECAKSYLSGFKFLFSKTNENLENFEKEIDHNNPERQLNLGYSIATIGGKIIRRVSDASVGENMDIKLVDGIINSEVKKINKIN